MKHRTEIRVDREEGCVYFDGEKHYLEEFEINEYFRGKDINQEVLTRHFRMLHAIRKLEGNRGILKTLVYGPDKGSNSIIYGLGGMEHMFFEEDGDDRETLLEMIGLSDGVVFNAPDAESKSPELGSCNMAITFTIGNVWNHRDLDYIREKYGKYVADEWDPELYEIFPEQFDDPCDFDSMEFPDDME